MVLVTAHALATRPAAARMAAIGVCAGVLVHAAAAVVGLSALLANSSVDFAAVKVTGAVFLSYSAFARSITLAGQPRRVRPSRSQGRWSQRRSVSRGFASAPHRSGRASGATCSTPRWRCCSCRCSPQFVDAGEAVFLKTLVLSGTFLAMGIVWLLAYVTFVSRVESFLRHDRVRRRIELVSGAVLVALGLRIAAEDASRSVSASLAYAASDHLRC